MNNKNKKQKERNKNQTKKQRYKGMNKKSIQNLKQKLNSIQIIIK